MSAKEQVQNATNLLHARMKQALEDFTEQTGLKITSTRWDSGEVLNDSGSALVIRYMRLRSTMETGAS